MFEVASSDLVNMGITVVSYTLKDIRDEEVSQTTAQLFFRLLTYKAHINNFVEIGHSIYCRGISISEGSAEYLQLESGFYSKTFYQRYLRKVIEYL